MWQSAQADKAIAWHRLRRADANEQRNFRGWLRDQLRCNPNAHFSALGKADAAPLVNSTCCLLAAEDCQDGDDWAGGSQPPGPTAFAISCPQFTPALGGMSWPLKQH